MEEKKNVAETTVKVDLKKPKPILLVVGIFAIVVILIFLVVSGIFGKEEEERVIAVSKSSLEKVLEISDLEAIKYTYNAVTNVKTKDGKTVKYYLAYEGNVTVGIDFEKVVIDLDDKNKKITVTLPETEIQEVYVDEDSLDFIYTKTKYENEEGKLATAIKSATKHLETQAKKDENLLKMARENAVIIIRGLMESWVHQIDSEYIFEIK